MKEKRIYKRFDLLAILAVIGCIGMLLFECIFIFELYDRAPDQVADILQAVTAPSAAEAPATPAPAATNPVVNPAKIPSAVAPVGDELKPSVVPVG